MRRESTRTTFGETDSLLGLKKVPSSGRKFYKFLVEIVVLRNFAEAVLVSSIVPFLLISFVPSFCFIVYFVV